MARRQRDGDTVLEPDVDGDGWHWAVSWTRSLASGDRDVWCRGVTYDAGTGSVRLSSERAVKTDPTLDQDEPSVSWMGESYLIAFREEATGKDYDVRVASLDSFDCLSCEGVGRTDVPHLVNFSAH